MPVERLTWVVVTALVLAACSAQEMEELQGLAQQLSEAAQEMEDAMGPDAAADAAAEDAATGANTGEPTLFARRWNVVPTIEARLSVKQTSGRDVLQEYLVTLTEEYRALYSGATSAAQTGDYNGYLSCHSPVGEDGLWKGDWRSPIRFGEASHGSDEGFLLAEDVGDEVLIAYAPPLVLPIDTPPECVEIDGEFTDVYFGWGSLDASASPVAGYPTYFETADGGGLVVGLVSEDGLEQVPSQVSATYRASETDGDVNTELSMSVTVRLEPAG